MKNSPVPLWCGVGRGGGGGGEGTGDRVLSRKFLLGGSVEYVWEGPTRSVKILQRVHIEI